jgi:hypothetical protein
MIHEKAPDGVTYIVHMRVPRDENSGAPFVALSDFTFDKRTAQAWLRDLQVAAGRFLRDRVRSRAGKGPTH